MLAAKEYLQDVPSHFWGFSLTKKGFLNNIFPVLVVYKNIWGYRENPVQKLVFSFKLSGFAYISCWYVGKSIDTFHFFFNFLVDFSLKMSYILQFLINSNQLLNKLTHFTVWALLWKYSKQKTNYYLKAIIMSPLSTGRKKNRTTQKIRTKKVKTISENAENFC